MELLSGPRESHGTPALEDHLYGLQQDLQVQREPVIENILRIQPDDLFKVRDLASSAHLPHAGDAGLDGEAGAVMILVLFPFVHRGRAGADEAHVPFQDIEELREFVQARLADELADAGLSGPVREDPVADHARVKVQLEHHPVGHAVLLHELLFPLLRVQIHGAELVDFKLLSVFPDALLLEEDRSRRGDIDDRADHQTQQQRERAAGEPREDIKETLDHRLMRGDIAVGQGEERVAVHGFHRLLFPGKLRDLQHDVDRDANLGAGRHGLFRDLRHARKIEKHLIDPFPADELHGGVHIGKGLHPGNGLCFLCSLCSRFPAVQEGRSLHGKDLKDVLIEASEDLIAADGVRKDKHLPRVLLFCRHPAHPEENEFFEEEPPYKGQRRGEEERTEKHVPGIEIRDMPGVHGKDQCGKGDRLQQDHRHQLLIHASAEDILIAADQKGHNKQEQGPDQNGISVIGGIQPGQLPEANKIRPGEGQIQTDQIQQDKIQMLDPVTSFFCIHFRHLPDTAYM